MPRWLSLALCALALSLPAAAPAADPELVKMAQQELVALGYDIDNTDGELTTKTVVAISKFQAENNMDVTGEATPQLIGALKAAVKQKDEPASATAATAPAPAAMTPEQQEADLRARQQACLEEKYAAAQERNKKKRGMMRLLSAVSRTSGMAGGELSQDISRATWVAYGANATADDLSAAAKDLGLTEEEMEECRNPP